MHSATRNQKIVPVTGSALERFVGCAQRIDEIDIRLTHAGQFHIAPECRLRDRNVQEDIRFFLAIVPVEGIDRGEVNMVISPAIALVDHAQTDSEQDPDLEDPECLAFDG